MSKKILGIIPARGGSKRLPHKNVQLLGGKPLVSHTIEAAIYSGVFSKIIVSSDDVEILDIAVTYDHVEAAKRPERLAGDKVKVLDLILEIAEREDLANDFDALALMLPTCPFRQARHLREGAKLLTDDVDAVVSVTEYEFPHVLNIRIDPDSGLMNPSEALRTGNTRSQDLPVTYRPNGGFYMSWWSALLKNRNWFVGNVHAFPMERLHSVDIDDATDMAYAQFLLDSNAVTLTNE